MNSDFLKQMQEALEKGGENEATKLINDIDELADKKIEEGFPPVTGEKYKEHPKVTEEEKDEANVIYDEAIDDIRKEDDKIARLAAIKRYESLINETNEEYDHIIEELRTSMVDTKKERDNTIQEMTLELDKMNDELIKTHGEIEKLDENAPHNPPKPKGDNPVA